MQSIVTQFMQQQTGYRIVAGQHTPWPEFRDQLRTWLAERYPNCMPTKSEIETALPPSVVLGRGPSSKWVLGNMSRDFSQPRRWVRVGEDRIRLESPRAA